MNDTWAEDFYKGKPELLSAHIRERTCTTCASYRPKCECDVDYSGWRLNPVLVKSRKWCDRFMQIAVTVSEWSKDSTKVGAVIVSKDKRIRATGYNGLPAGVVDTPDRLERPKKYRYIVHAELNAVLQAGRDAEGSILFCTHAPCTECAKAIIQAGVDYVIYGSGRTSMDCNDAIVKEMFDEADMRYAHIDDCNDKEVFW